MDFLILDRSFTRTLNSLHARFALQSQPVNHSSHATYQHSSDRPTHHSAPAFHGRTHALPPYQDYIHAKHPSFPKKSNSHNSQNPSNASNCRIFQSRNSAPRSCEIRNISYPYRIWIRQRSLNSGKEGLSKGYRMRPVSVHSLEGIFPRPLPNSMWRDLQHWNAGFIPRIV